MKRLLLLGEMVLVASLHAEVPAAGSLLDRVISHPGSYSQVCDMMTADADIPYRALKLTDFAGAAFSKSNLALIEKNRGPLVQAIRARLPAIDFTQEAKTPAEDTKPEENFDGDAYGCDPKSLNPLLLDLILQLKAIETLPELLTVEQKLVKGIARAKDDADAPPPVVAGWFVGIMGPSDSEEDAAKRDRRLNLFHARIAQRDLVILMAVLLREKAYGPYLKTPLEAAYAKGLKNHAAKYPAYKPGDPIPEGKYGATYSVDPITHLLVSSREFVSIPYTRESRDEVRAAAAQWISEHP